MTYNNSYPYSINMNDLKREFSVAGSNELLSCPRKFAVPVSKGSMDYAGEFCWLKGIMY